MLDFKKLSNVENAKAERIAKVKDSLQKAREARAKEQKETSEGSKKRIEDSVKNTRTLHRPTVGKKAISVKDSAKEEISKRIESKRREIAIRDSINRRKLIKRIKDELTETTSADEAKDVAINALETVDAPVVVEAVIDILKEVSDKLPNTDGGEGDADEVADSEKKKMIRKKRMDSIKKRIALRKKAKAVADSKEAKVKKPKTVTPKKGGCK